MGQCGPSMGCKGADSPAASAVLPNFLTGWGSVPEPGLGDV